MIKYAMTKYAPFPGLRVFPEGERFKKQIHNERLKFACVHTNCSEQ